VIKFVELFAGIGGFSLGFERTGMECVGHVEIDKYAQKVLKKHWPDVPLYPDVTKIKGDEFGKIDLLCGGFPCQDVSIAGNKEGINAPRTGLYYEIIRVATVCRPRWIVLENVANLLTSAEWMGVVFGELAKIGYNVEWEVIRAYSFGFPHTRPRIFIVAYTDKITNRLVQRQGDNREQGNRQKRSVLGRNIAKRNIKRDWFKIVRRICGVNNGVPPKVDQNKLRLECLGNALIPQIAEFIGNKIIESEINLDKSK